MGEHLYHWKTHFTVTFISVYVTFSANTLLFICKCYFKVYMRDAPWDKRLQYKELYLLEVYLCVILYALLGQCRANAEFETFHFHEEDPKPLLQFDPHDRDCVWVLHRRTCMHPQSFQPRWIQNRQVRQHCWKRFIKHSEEKISLISK